MRRAKTRCAVCASRVFLLGPNIHHIYHAQVQLSQHAHVIDAISAPHIWSTAGESHDAHTLLAPAHPLDRVKRHLHSSQQRKNKCVFLNGKHRFATAQAEILDDLCGAKKRPALGEYCVREVRFEKSTLALGVPRTVADYAVIHIAVAACCAE